MDPISTAFSVIEGIMKAIGLAKSAGMLGGSTAWLSYAEDLGAVVGNFRGFVATMVTDPAEYDRIAALPEAERESEIRRRLIPETWEIKEERIKRELGTT